MISQHNQTLIKTMGLLAFFMKSKNLVILVLEFPSAELTNSQSHHLPTVSGRISSTTAASSKTSWQRIRNGSAKRAPVSAPSSENEMSKCCPAMREQYRSARDWISSTADRARSGHFMMVNLGKRLGFDNFETEAKVYDKLFKAGIYIASLSNLLYFA